jgi:hypothetical protein
MDNKYRKTDMLFSALIQQLYGKENYLKIKDFSSVTSVKKYYLDIIKSIYFAIEETIAITDKEHMQELLETLDRYEKVIRSSKVFEQIDQVMITLQSEMIFLLIGNLPNRSMEKRVINRQGVWKLNNIRQIQYVQTNLQKRNLIFKAVKGKYSVRFGGYGKFKTEIFIMKCHSNSEELIEWLKVNHVDIYADLF